MNQQERQQELRKTLAGFEGRQSKLAGEAKSLAAKRDEYSQQLETLKAKHLEACRAEALGQTTDREKIERDIATVSAKITGTQALLAEKEGERAQLRDTCAPFEEELQNLVAAEARERLLAEVEQCFIEGKEEITRLFRLQKAHRDRINLLRSKYEADPVVRSAAYTAAERLENARGGVRIQETFTPEELKELKAAV